MERASAAGSALAGERHHPAVIAHPQLSPKPGLDLSDIPPAKGCGGSLDAFLFTTRLDRSFDDESDYSASHECDSPLVWSIWARDASPEEADVSVRPLAHARANPTRNRDTVAPIRRPSSSCVFDTAIVLSVFCTAIFLVFVG